MHGVVAAWAAGFAHQPGDVLGCGNYCLLLFFKFSFKFCFTYSEKQSLPDAFAVQVIDTAAPSLTPSAASPQGSITVGS